MKWLMLIMLYFYSILGIAQHGFPQGHWCNTDDGWNCKRCRALAGMRTPEINKVITVPHRGLWGGQLQPEGSLQSVIAAYNEKYMFVEVDLILCKDRALVLLHDQQTNRQTSLPKTFSTDGGITDNGSFVRSLNYNTQTTNTVPDLFGFPISNFPPLKDGYYIDRYGNLTTQHLNDFNDLCDWISEKEIVVSLDIKAGIMQDPTIKSEYLETIKICLQTASSKGVLHQLIFKPGASGQITVSEIRNYLMPLGLWDEFSSKTNVVLINIYGQFFPLATDKTYIDEWLGLGSLIGIEHIFKTWLDPLCIPQLSFGNKSVIQYTQDYGKRTGVFHLSATDNYGAAIGRGNYFNPPNSVTLSDLRGNMEFLFSYPPTGIKLPGILVTDRPDIDMSMLQLYGMNSKYTLRTGDY